MCVCVYRLLDYVECRWLVVIASELLLSSVSVLDGWLVSEGCPGGTSEHQTWPQVGGGGWMSGSGPPLLSRGCGVPPLKHGGDLCIIITNCSNPSAKVFPSKCLTSRDGWTYLNNVS